jgi:hypothetical protein
MNTGRTILTLAAYLLVTAACVCLLQVLCAWLMAQAGSEGRAALIQANTWVQTLDEQRDGPVRQTGGTR